MKVKKITVSNLKAVSELTADFNGCTAIITGGNNKGKSSFLRSLPDRVRGTKPDVVVKQGESEGFAEWELTDGSKFVWKFDTKTKRGETLTFTTKDNIKTSVTREIANRYFPGSFDIDKFLNSTPKKQSEILQGLVGLDFGQIDAQYKAAYEERTRCNTIAKLEADKVVDINESLPDTPIDTDVMFGQINDANTANHKRSSFALRLKDKKDELVALQEKIKSLQNDIEAGDKWLDEHPVIDVAEIQVKYSQATEQNKKIDANEAAKQQKLVAETAKSAADIANQEVKQLEEQRKEMIRQANLPDGFQFSADGILYNGLPLTKEQQSSSGLYIAALKLASMNLGEVRTLHFDASTLDRNNLTEIEKWANANDLQLLIERPDFDGGDIQYVILSEVNCNKQEEEKKAKVDVDEDEDEDNYSDNGHLTEADYQTWMNL